MLINIIAPTHRILGETMLLIALVGVIFAIVGLVRKKELEKPERIFAIVYSGLLDLQALLGLVFYFLLPGPVRPTILHPILMVLAVVVVHIERRWQSSPVPTRHWAQLGIYGLSLLLVFAGRMIVA
jgi:heme A synthase